MNKPLADRLRPSSIDDIVGQRHLLAPGKPLRKIVESGEIPNLIFYGPSGVGKTTLATYIANKTHKTLKKLNGTTASTADIKSIVSGLDTFEGINGILLYLDEILEFKSVEPKEVEKALSRAAKLLGEEQGTEVELCGGAAEKIAAGCGGDVRKALNALELSAIAADTEDGVKKITVEIAEQLVQKSSMRYDRDGDEHYDIVSAYQKSMRGSDPDAALHYLGRLLEAGDLPSACRRLMVCACEDVGLAYPQIIPIVKACVDIAQAVGLPEARIPLADAVIMVCNAPKSNSGEAAIDAALGDIRRGNSGPVPRRLQNMHYDGEDNPNKGQHYIYPHDYPNHYTYQQYLPDAIKDRRYYRFGDNKNEQAFKAYWDRIKNEK